MKINKKAIVSLLLGSLVISLAYIHIKEKNPKTGTVVILNGTSSAGKTSIINELKKVYGSTYEVVDIDTFTSSYISSHPISEQLESEKLDEKVKKQLAEAYQRTFIDSFYSSIKDKALKGHNILVDTVPVLDSTIEYEQISNILKGIKTIKILLYCPLDITIARVKQRNLTGLPEEHREVTQPIGQYQLLYKPQETKSEQIIDKISSKETKQLLRSAINSFMKALPDELKNKVDEVTKGLDRSYQEFVQQFKLDELEEVAVVSKKPYDLILNCKNTPTQLAKEIMKILK
jgi:chloramphenicol 3-O phosphotransferase